MTAIEGLIIAMKRCGMGEKELQERIRFASVNVPDAPINEELIPGTEEQFIEQAMAYKEIMDDPMMKELMRQEIKQKMKNN